MTEEKSKKVNESQIDFLKPCPFCGSRDVHLLNASPDGDEWSVTCKDCNVWVDHTVDAMSRDEAIELWNRREERMTDNTKCTKSICEEKECDDEPYYADNITYMGPNGPYRIRSYKYVATVCWYEIVGCSMWDMGDEKHEEVVAECKTYEDAIEAALPYCREKTAYMQTHGFDKSSHAVVKVKDKCEVEYIKENEHEG